MRAELSRREVLQLLAVGAGTMLLPVRLARAIVNTAGSARTRGFLTADELAILDAATARVVPTDTQIGARECGVVDYIQSLLSFMPGSDANCDRHVNAADVAATVLALQSAQPGCPQGGDVDGNGIVDVNDVVAAEAAVFGARPVYAGGPFSDRQPQPHFLEGSRNCRACHVAPVQQASGAAAIVLPTLDYYPPNFFEEHLPLSRLQALSWKIRILGAEAVPEVASNPLANELLETDLRRKYRTGLAELDARSQQEYGVPFVQLPPVRQSAVLNKTDPDFVTLLTYHTVEGMLCAPEYGGNRNRLGWQLIGFDGDSQPLGYEIYDESVPGNYRERPDKPNSGPNPDEDCSGFSNGINRFLSVISSAELTQPGRKFANPYCFEVPA